MKISLFILIAVFAIGSASGDEKQPCYMGCTPHLEPICAKSKSNGTYRTFDNPCMMELQNTCYKGDYKQSSKGVCPQDRQLPQYS
ncbi:hypothetical protein O3M35_009337 [Rhynocoris fuscipes]|uniref:Kazal-like domain-containing protein n=1 Tax=Rhynocoris fuscipes TaxID=488301 RepID=A0AAW1D2J8_9HEMI